MSAERIRRSLAKAAGPARADGGDAPHCAISVIVATYNRAESVERLLLQLAAQRLDPSRFEVIVVDDGSVEPVVPRLAGLTVPYRLDVVSQANAGPAAARHNALVRASGDIAVLVDDDMRIEPAFLDAHLAAHPPASRCVALGPLRGSAGLRLPLFERCHIALLEKLESEVASGRAVLRGTHLYTGNVSFRRADYFRVGGFDQAFRISEDTELGVRLERAGVRFVFAADAVAVHDSDHSSVEGWLRRSRTYGDADARVAEKHPALPWVSPWRFLTMMHPLARPLLAASVLAPALMAPVARLALRVSSALAAAGAERIAIAGTTVVYGMQYFMGVRDHAGSLRGAAAGFVHYRALRRDGRGEAAQAPLPT